MKMFFPCRKIRLEKRIDFCRLARCAGLIMLVSLLSFGLCACGSVKNIFHRDKNASATQSKTTTPKNSKTTTSAVPPQQKLPPKETRESPLPSFHPDRLVGLNQTAVEKILGKPDFIRRDGVSVIWGYQEPQCVMRVSFYPNIETKNVQVLQYSFEDAKGGKLNDTASCMGRVRLSKTDDRQ